MGNSIKLRRYIKNKCFIPTITIALMLIINKKVYSTTVQDMNLDTGGINDPISTTGSPDYWLGSRVYLGNEGFLWRVLDDEGLLFSEEILLSKSYHFELADTTWEKSSLRSYLNGNYNEQENVDYSNNNFLDTYFTSIEKDAIKDSLVINNDNNEGTSNDRPGGEDTIDKVYLLSLDEVRNKDYGFVNYKTRVNSLGNNTETWWWLRSKGYNSNSFAAYIRIDGYVFSSGQAVFNTNNSGKGIRPAFNLDMEQVAFTLAEGKSKKSYGKFGDYTGLIEDKHASDNTWRLTLKGTEESLEVSTESDLTNLYSSQEIIINHKEAAILENATQISAMLINNENSILYYGEINTDINSKESIVCIPQELENGEYTLKVFAESINDDNLTDYVSEFSDFAICIKDRSEIEDNEEEVPKNDEDEIEDNEEEEPKNDEDEIEDYEEDESENDGSELGDYEEDEPKKDESELGDYNKDEPKNDGDKLEDIINVNEVELELEEADKIIIEEFVKELGFKKDNLYNDKNYHIMNNSDGSIADEDKEGHENDDEISDTLGRNTIIKVILFSGIIIIITVSDIKISRYKKKIINHK